MSCFCWSFITNVLLLIAVAVVGGGGAGWLVGWFERLLVGWFVGLFLLFGYSTID